MIEIVTVAMAEKDIAIGQLKGQRLILKHPDAGIRLQDHRYRFTGR